MFRFTIRELVLVTVIVAMALGWRLDHRATAHSTAVAKEEVRFLRIYLAWIEAGSPRVH
jgi:hypothetical protein